MNQPIKLVALDLDGTLLHSDKSISAANAEAVGRAVEAGIHIVLASGRMHYSIVKYARQLDLPKSSYIISYSGGMVRQIASDSPLAERQLLADVADWLVGFTKEHGLHLNYYLEDVLYTQKPDRWSDLYEQRTGCKSEFVGDLSRFNGQCPTKLVIIDDKEITYKLHEEMRERFGSSVQILITDNEYLEFMSPAATKANGLEDIAAKLEIIREECMALGDGNNDLTMLEWAGRGIVMANGRLELLERVKEHAPAADEDGVATILNALSP